MYAEGQRSQTNFHIVSELFKKKEKEYQLKLMTRPPQSPDLNPNCRQRSRSVGINLQSST